MAKDRRPFEPFWVRTADGREVEVRHPDAIAWSGERAQIVAYVSPDGGWEWIDVALVMSLRIPTPWPRELTEGGAN
jgi:hypothetical protein